MHAFKSSMVSRLSKLKEPLEALVETVNAYEAISRKPSSQSIVFSDAEIQKTKQRFERVKTSLSTLIALSEGAKLSMLPVQALESLCYDIHVLDKSYGTDRKTIQNLLQHSETDANLKIFLHDLEKLFEYFPPETSLAAFPPALQESLRHTQKIREILPELKELMGEQGENVPSLIEYHALLHNPNITHRISQLPHDMPESEKLSVISQYPFQDMLAFLLTKTEHHSVIPSCLCIGENHWEEAVPGTLAMNMKSFKHAGVGIIFLEHVDSDHQHLLNRFMAGEEVKEALIDHIARIEVIEQKGTPLSDYEKVVNRGWAEAYYAMLEVARAEGMELIGIDTPEHTITHREGVKRAVEGNKHFSTIIKDKLYSEALGAGRKSIAFIGNRHTSFGLFKDKELRFDEAMQILRFGAVISSPLADHPIHDLGVDYRAGYSVLLLDGQKPSVPPAPPRCTEQRESLNGSHAFQFTVPDMFLYPASMEYWEALVESLPDIIKQEQREGMSDKEVRDKMKPLLDKILFLIKEVSPTRMTFSEREILREIIPAAIAKTILPADEKDKTELDLPTYLTKLEDHFQKMLEAKGLSTLFSARKRNEARRTLGPERDSWTRRMQNSSPAPERPVTLF